MHIKYKLQSAYFLENKKGTGNTHGIIFHLYWIQIEEIFRKGHFKKFYYIPTSSENLSKVLGPLYKWVV